MANGFLSPAKITNDSVHLSKKNFPEGRRGGEKVQTTVIEQQ